MSIFGSGLRWRSALTQAHPTCNRHCATVRSLISRLTIPLQESHLTAGDRKRCRQVRDEPVHDVLMALQDRNLPDRQCPVAQEAVSGPGKICSRRSERGCGFPITAENFFRRETGPADFFAVGPSSPCRVHDDVRRSLRHKFVTAASRERNGFPNRALNGARLHFDNTDFSLGVPGRAPVSPRAIGILYKTTTTVSNKRFSCVQMNARISFWSHMWSPVR